MRSWPPAGELLINDPGRLDGVTTVRVDEHCWRHTRFGDEFVTVVIDLTPTRTDTEAVQVVGGAGGPLEEGVQGLARRTGPGVPGPYRGGRHGQFTGYKTAATEAIDEVVTVMDPFHVVALAGDKLDTCADNACNGKPSAVAAVPVTPLFGIRRVVRTRRPANPKAMVPAPRRDRGPGPCCWR